MSVAQLTEIEKDDIIQLALQILAARHRRGRKLENVEATRQYLQLLLAERKNEVFGVLFLDNGHRVLQFEELFFGTIDGAAVHPRVVMTRALALNAAAVIFVHNHPSGVCEPSQADRSLTDRLQQVLSYIDVRVLDHLIVSAEGTVSMAERGLL